MARMVMATCIVLALTGQAPAAWLSCTTQSVVRLNDDGTLKQGRAGSTWMINPETGWVEHTPGQLSNRIQWHVAQKGNDANDTVLVLADSDFITGHTARLIEPLQGARLEEALAYATSWFIRIRRWHGQHKTLFLRWVISDLDTGTCEPAK